MTKEQQAIIRLKNSGLSYSQISSQGKMSVTTRTRVHGATITVTGVYNSQTKLTADEIALSLIHRHLCDSEVDLIPTQSEYVMQQKEGAQ